MLFKLVLLDEINSRIQDVEGQIENFFDAVGKSGSKVINLLEKKIERLQDELQELENRKGELTLLIANSPSKINAQIVLDALKDFSELYETLLPAERAVYLQRIIRDVVVSEKKLDINIYGVSKPPRCASKERSVWLPGLVGVRTFGDLRLFQYLMILHC